MTTSGPRHVAIIMDGNGRWAQARGLPRHAGHKAGIRPVRLCVEACGERKIDVLTLFAFSSENWRRPADEIGRLMELFMESLTSEIDELHGNGVRLRFIGDRRQLSVRLQARLNDAEDHTRDNKGLTLVIAVGYGGRWDIVRAAQALARRCVTGASAPESIDEAAVAAELSLAGLPDPDLFIRTGGERRISNFLLWNLAYTELYFCDVLWPDFSIAEFDGALDYFGQRQRRFGMAAAQAGSGS